ncbi:MAG TPA: hypothetical protein VD927_12380 [Chryseosolibacter sp.]|nr:hypothetical protein [Chryseosolibacter sp.]
MPTRSFHNSNALTEALVAKLSNRLDYERLNKFVTIAIEANQHHLDLMGDSMSLNDKFEMQAILNQGAFLSLVLANLR